MNDARDKADIVCVQLAEDFEVVNGEHTSPLHFVVTTAHVSVQCCTLQMLLRTHHDLAVASVREKRRRERAVDALLCHDELLVRAT